jgi:hypothetical protein
MELKNVMLKIGAMMKDYAFFLHPWRFWPWVFIVYLLARARRPVLAAAAGALLLVSLYVWSTSFGRSTDLILVPATSYALIYPLSALGLLFASRGRKPIHLLVLVWVAVLLTGVIYIPMVRIRWSVDFIAVVLAAAGVDGILGRLAPYLRRKNAPPAGAEAST